MPILRGHRVSRLSGFAPARPDTIRRRWRARHRGVRAVLRPANSAWGDRPGGLRHNRRSTHARPRRATPAGAHRRRCCARSRLGDRRRGIQFDQPSDRIGERRRDRARRCHIVGRAVLQQADPGRHVRAFQSDRRVRLVFRSFFTTCRRGPGAASPIRRLRNWPKTPNSSASKTLPATSHDRCD